MPSWNDVREHLRNTYKLADDEGELVSMVWSFDTDRSQKVVIRSFSAFDREMVEIKSAFAQRDQAEPVDLLTRNAELALGTIALSGDHYFVVYNTPLTHLALNDLELFMSRVAAVADVLEDQYASTDRF